MRHLRGETAFLTLAVLAMEALRADDFRHGPVGGGGRSLRRLQRCARAAGLASLPVRRLAEPAAAPRTVGTTVAWALSELYGTGVAAYHPGRVVLEGDLRTMQVRPGLRSLGQARAVIRTLCRALLEQPQFCAAATPAVVRALLDPAAPPLHHVAAR